MLLASFHIDNVNKFCPWNTSIFELYISLSPGYTLVSQLLISQSHGHQSRYVDSWEVSLVLLHVLKLNIYRNRMIWPIDSNSKNENSWNTCSINLTYFSIFFVYNLKRALSVHQHYYFFGKPIWHSVRHIWRNHQRWQIHPGSDNLVQH